MSMNCSSFFIWNLLGFSRLCSSINPPIKSAAQKILWLCAFLKLVAVEQAKRANYLFVDKNIENKIKAIFGVWVFDCQQSYQKTTV